MKKQSTTVQLRAPGERPSARLALPVLISSSETKSASGFASPGDGFLERLWLGLPGGDWIWPRHIQMVFVMLLQPSQYGDTALSREAPHTHSHTPLPRAPLTPCASGSDGPKVAREVRLKAEESPRGRSSRCPQAPVAR